MQFVFGVLVILLVIILFSVLAYFDFHLGVFFYSSIWNFIKGNANWTNLLICALIIIVPLLLKKIF